MGLQFRVLVRFLSSAWLAAAISIAASAFPAAAAADQTSCQPGAAPPSADPSTAGGVIIHVTASNTVSWCSAAVIEANSDIVPGTEYPERATSQSPSSNPVSNAISINRLLTIAQVNPATVSFTYVVRPSNGTWSTLSAADLSAQPTTFVSGLPPIVWINGGETDYLRPLRGPADTNADDLISYQNEAPLDLYVSSGPLLGVTARATPAKVHLKQPVSFVARVAGQASADGTLIYKWTFQDGFTATGSTVTHSFGFTGIFPVIVTVQGSGNNSGGASEPVPVTVGNPPTGPDNGKPAGANPNRNVTPGGATDSRGEKPRTAPTRTRTAGSGTSNPSNNRTSGQSRNTGSQSTTPAQTTTAQHNPSQTTTPPQTTTTPPQTTTTQQTSTPPRTTSVAAATSSRKPAVRARHSNANGRSVAHERVQPKRSQEVTIVRGRLIADVIPISAVELAQQNQTAGRPASQAHAPSASLGGGSVAPIAGIAGGCVIMLLFGSGAGLELRSQRRSVAPTRAG